MEKRRKAENEKKQINDERRGSKNMRLGTLVDKCKREE